MMKKKALVTMGILTALTLAACGEKKEKPAASTEVSTQASTETSTSESKSDTSTSTVEESTSQSTEEQTSVNASGELKKITEDIKDEMEAEEADILFTSTQPTKVKQGNVEIDIEEYSIIEVKDFHQDFSIPFGRQTDDGGIFLAKITVTNKENQDIWYSPMFDMTFTGATSAFSNTRKVLPENYANIGSDLTANKNLIKKGESVTGYLPMALDPEELSSILELGLVSYEVPAAYNKADSVKTADAIGKAESVQLSVSKSGAETVKENAKFYQDKATIKNMGTKTMIEEKEGIDDSQTIGEITTTLKGYQFTEFEPNEEEAPRFTDFNGVVLLTLKYDIKNESDKEVAFTTANSTLLVDDGSLIVIGQGMLLDYKSTDVVKTGETKELIQVFAMDKEQYDKLWKDKTYKAQLALSDSSAKDLLKGKKFEFDLK